MPRAVDKKVIQAMRGVNIHEIGSNTREHKDITEMKFDANDEEVNDEPAAYNLDKSKSNDDLEEWRNDPKNWLVSVSILRYYSVHRLSSSSLIGC